MQDHAFLELAALLSCLRIVEEGEEPPRRTAENPRAKRPHTTSASERIVQHALERPWQWMPVLAMLVKRYVRHPSCSLFAAGTTSTRLAAYIWMV